MSVLLSARGLTKSYAHRPLFAGLSFDLRVGERVGLIRPNGAGKSTLLEFPGAVVLVSHDRDLTDRLCTAVVGLDGRGGAAIFGDVGQWLTASEPRTAG